MRRLIATQFPQWRDLPVTPVAVDGWDNRTYRLGARLSVRLPTAASYASAVGKEDRWLPILAPSLPVAVPVPLATGRPGGGYPFCWSVRPWLDGRTALEQPPLDLGELCDLDRRVPAGFAADRRNRRADCRCAQLLPWRVAQVLRQRDPRVLTRCAAASMSTLPRQSGTPRSPRPGAGHPCGFTATWPAGTCSCGTADSLPSSTWNVRRRRPRLRPRHRVDLLPWAEPRYLSQP